MDNFYNTNTSESSSMVRNNGGKEKNKKKGSFGNRSSKPVKLSTDPQSVAARERRHRISDRFKILQSLVPGGTKMDTVSMLEEAINYVKFLKTQIWLHQTTMMINLMDGGDSSMVGHCNQQCVHDFCSQTNMVGQVFQGPQPFPLGGTCFQVEEEIKPFDMHP